MRNNNNNHKTPKLKMPSKATLSSRKSTINNAFAHSIVPYIRPNDDEYEKYAFKDEFEKKQCVYCGAPAQSMDHFQSIIKEKDPSGYITDIRNLVPCCAKCNSSKGSKEFSEWYGLPETRDYIKAQNHFTTETMIEQNHDRIASHFKKNPPIQYDFKSIVGQEEWEEFLNMKKELLEQIEKCQEKCKEIAEKISKQTKQDG